jgi:hypothetical protein
MFGSNHITLITYPLKLKLTESTGIEMRSCIFSQKEKEKQKQSASNHVLVPFTLPRLRNYFSFLLW